MTTDRAPADEIFLSHSLPDPSSLQSSVIIEAGRFGWASSFVPIQTERVLFLTQAGAKSDWWDAETRQIRENSASLEVFQRVAAVLRKRLRRPTWAYNIVYDGGATSLP